MSAPMPPIFWPPVGAPITAVDEPAVRCAFCGTVLHRTGADAPLGVDVTSAAADEPSEETWPSEAPSSFGGEMVTERIVDGNRFASVFFGLVMGVPIVVGALVAASQALLWTVTTSDTDGRWQVLAAGALAVAAAGWLWMTLRGPAETTVRSVDDPHDELRAF